MLINLTDIFTEEGKSVTREVMPELTEICFGGENYGIREKTPVRLTLTHLKPGKALVEAEGKISLDMRCDRCLRPVVKELEYHASEEVSAPDAADGQEEENILDGYQLNVDSLISNEIFACWPMKVLCREDCRGLCRVCGKDLNEGDCGCDTFVPDPRMAAIMDIFRENKEV